MRVNSMPTKRLPVEWLKEESVQVTLVLLHLLIQFSGKALKWVGMILVLVEVERSIKNATVLNVVKSEA